MLGSLEPPITVLAIHADVHSAENPLTVGETAKCAQCQWAPNRGRIRVFSRLNPSASVTESVRAQQPFFFF